MVPRTLVIRNPSHFLGFQANDDAVGGWQNWGMSLDEHEPKSNALQPMVNVPEGTSALSNLQHLRIPHRQ